MPRQQTAHAGHCDRRLSKRQPLTSPNSWQARKIRMAISPRLAISTLLNRRVCSSGMSIYFSLIVKGALSLRTELPEPLSKRDIAMFFGRVLIAFVLQHVQGVDQPWPCLAGFDHVVNIPHLRGDVGIGKVFAIFFNEFFFLCAPGSSASASSRR